MRSQTLNNTTITGKHKEKEKEGSQGKVYELSDQVAVEQKGSK